MGELEDRCNYKLDSLGIVLVFVIWRERERVISLHPQYPQNTNYPSWRKGKCHRQGLSLLSNCHIQGFVLDTESTQYKFLTWEATRAQPVIQWTSKYVSTQLYSVWHLFRVKKSIPATHSASLITSNLEPNTGGHGWLVAFVTFVGSEILGKNRV